MIRLPGPLVLPRGNSVSSVTNNTPEIETLKRAEAFRRPLNPIVSALKRQTGKEGKRIRTPTRRGSNSLSVW